MMVVFFNDAATTEIYTLSLHDALPISTCEQTSSVAVELASDKDLTKLVLEQAAVPVPRGEVVETEDEALGAFRDRKSTRLNSSHANIPNAVFCLHNTLLPYVFESASYF